MKRTLTYALIALLGLLSITLLCPAHAQVAAAPSLMNFQGRLAKPDGTPVPDGNYSIRFSLWTAVTSGTEKWNQTINPVAVRNGTFAVLLNTSTGAADKFNNNLWLEIRIGTDPPLTPRQQLVSVAYAMKADSVKDGSITGASIANGSIGAADLAPGALNNLSWLLGGNSGTNPASHFLGTTDSQPLVFRTNNTEKLRLDSAGNLGLGTNTPTALLHLNGPVKINGTNTLEFGAGVAGKETNAGKIGYQTFTTGSLDIVGAGTGANRAIKFWNEGGAAFAGPIMVDGTARMTGFQLLTGAGANKVLTSDASGAGTWQTVTSLLDNNSITNSMIQSLDWSKITNVPPNSGVSWSLTGNSGINPASNFLGTINNQPLVFKVNNRRAMQYSYAERTIPHDPPMPDSHYSSTNVLGGSVINSIAAGVVGATIAGGGIDQFYPNQVTDDFGTVGGGFGNTASNLAATVGGGEDNNASARSATVGGGIRNTASNLAATVGGGQDNTASGDNAAVGGGVLNTASGGRAMVAGGQGNTASAFTAAVVGGSGNTASGSHATVAGGLNNTASSWCSFAAGQRAKAHHGGSFVWADNTDADFGSTIYNQFNVRASGGVRIFTKSDLSIGVTLDANDSSWNSVSDRNKKTAFQPVDTLDLLERLVAIPITTWNYKGVENPIRHIGPMAQDFFAAFQVGRDDKHIGTIDADGVALAAIQGLNKKLEAKEKRLQAEVTGLKSENAELKARLEALEAAVQRLTAQPK